MSFFVTLQDYKVWPGFEILKKNSRFLLAVANSDCQGMGDMPMHVYMNVCLLWPQ